VGHDRAASFGLLYGPVDTPEGWLRAGQALAAGWLRATVLGVSLLPLSAVMEVEATRSRLGQMLVAGCWPYLVMRFGHHEPQPAAATATPRLPASQTID
jgi:hypothetical protein